MAKKTSVHRDTAGEVAEAISTIQEAHRVGRDLCQRLGMRTGDSKATIDTEAKRLKLNPDTVRKRRQFGDPANGFTDGDLHELCQLCREHGNALGVSFVGKFVSIPKAGRQRQRFIHQAIREHWSYLRVEKEIRTQFGKRRLGGRRMRMAKDVPGVLNQIDEECQRFHRLVGALSEESAVIGIRSLPSDVGRDLTKIATQISAFRAKVQQHLVVQRKS